MATRDVWMTVALCCFAGSAAGEWPSDPMVNVPLCNAVGYQAGNGLVAVPSIDGGVIAAWQDDRAGDNDIYAQRVHFGGEIQWPVDGVPVCTAAGDQLWLQGISDGVGGAIFVWIDLRDGEGDLFAQRIDAGGSLMWPVGSPSLDGVPVCATNESQSWAQMVSDGDGGAIITWEHGSSPNDLYAQRLNADGEIQWPSGSPSGDGVVVSAVSGIQTHSRIVEDGTGGAILVWTDGRNNSTTSYDIYAQRISGSGTTLWGAGDAPVCVADGAQDNPAIAPDGLGGAFVAWDHNAPGGDVHVWAQYLNDTGATMWPGDGIMFADSSLSSIHTLRGSADGRGGAMFVWEDIRDYAITDRDLYAQHVVAAGAVWPAGGVLISAETGNQKDPAIGSPRDGSVVIAWKDGRVGESTSDIYALEILDGAFPSGPAHGLAVSTADYQQWGAVVGAGGLGDPVLVWADTRNLATGVDVYAQGVFLITIFVDGFESGDTTAWDAQH